MGRNEWEQWLTLRRIDFVGIYLLLVVMAAQVTYVQVVAPMLDWVGGEPLRTTLMLDTAAVANGSGPWDARTPRPGVDLGWDGMVEATFADPEPQVWLAHLLPGATIAVTTLLVTVLTWRVVRSIQGGTPFTAMTLRRVRTIAAILMVTPLLLVIPIAVRAAVLARHAFETDGLSFAFEIPWPYLAVSLVGLLLAALAQAFAHGVELEDDVEGLV